MSSLYYTCCCCCFCYGYCMLLFMVQQKHGTSIAEFVFLILHLASCNINITNKNNRIESVLLCEAFEFVVVIRTATLANRLSVSLSLSCICGLCFFLDGLWCLKILFSLLLILIFYVVVVVVGQETCTLLMKNEWPLVNRINAFHA